MKIQHAKIRMINSSRKEAKFFIISSLWRNVKKHIIIIAKIICPLSTLLSQMKSGSKATSMERKEKPQKRPKKREDRIVSLVR
jgi:hypothetical protein